jgi:type IV pilus assembly protein PilA
MLSTIKQFVARDEEEGFTLIELMVVVLIIAILLAIAIPTFLGARNSANARAAQSNLSSALTAEQTYWTNNQAFSNLYTAMDTIEPNVNWESSAPASTDKPNSVAVVVGNNSDVFLQALGADKNCYTVYATNGAGVGSPPVATLYNVTPSASGACTLPAATAFPSAANSGKASGNPGSAGAPVAGQYYTSW